MQVLIPGKDFPIGRTSQAADAGAQASAQPSQSTGITVGMQTGPDDVVWKLFPLLGQEIQTQSGITVKLPKVFCDRVVLHPADAPKVVYVEPDEVIMQ